MVIIEKSSGKCYENLTNRKAAALIGVHRLTIHRWKRKASFRETDRWVIYFYAKKM